MIEVTDPTLYLFTYQFKQGLGVEEERATQSYQKFLSQLPDKVSQLVATSITPEVRAKVVDTAYPKASFKFIGLRNEYQVQGEFRRCSYDDSYGSLFDTSVKITCNGDVQFKQAIAQLKDLISELNSSSDRFQLGQTWIISGILPKGNDKELETLAKHTYETLISKDGWQYHGWGKYVGVTIVEFWRSSPDRKWENVQPNSHLIAIFYPDMDRLKDGWGFYKEWQDLLLTRHKMIWAYQNTRSLKPKLLQLYNDVFSIQDYSHLSLERLQAAIQSLSQFVICFNYLEFNLYTIKTNLHNYDLYLQTLETSAGHLGDTDLSFLKEFSQSVKQTYIKQIETDIENFRVCLDVLTHLTDTIRGMVDIRQAQGDRRFHAIVGIVGVGLATGGMVASASSNHVDKIKTYPVFKAMNGSSDLFLVLLFSTTMGVLASLLTGAIIKLWPKNRP